MNPVYLHIYTDPVSLDVEFNVVKLSMTFALNFNPDEFLCYFCCSITINNDDGLPRGICSEDVGWLETLRSALRMLSKFEVSTEP